MDQFRSLLPKDTTAFKEDISELLEKKMGLDPTTYQIGKTKVHQNLLSFVFSQHYINPVSLCFLVFFYAC